MTESGLLRMRFDGGLLRRGFWLYVWDIGADNRRVLYVGRTGDSSSPNASSPFSRIGQHLDGRGNAKANSMSRRLKQEGLDPATCTFSMVAIGPLYPEQPNFAAHRGVRDRVGALEAAVARLLRQRGYSVLGVHGSKTQPDEQLWQQVIALVDPEFPETGRAD